MIRRLRRLLRGRRVLRAERDLREHIRLYGEDDARTRERWAWRDRLVWGAASARRGCPTCAGLAHHMAGCTDTWAVDEEMGG